jgi:hypothetical protein
MLQVKYCQTASVTDRYVYEKGREDRTNVITISFPLIYDQNEMMNNEYGTIRSNLSCEWTTTHQFDLLGLFRTRLLSSNTGQISSNTGHSSF